MRPFIFLPLVFLLPGCVASVVGDVVTAPIKVVSKTADVMTTRNADVSCASRKSGSASLRANATKRVRIVRMAMMRLACAMKRSRPKLPLKKTALTDVLAQLTCRPV